MFTLETLVIVKLYYIVYERQFPLHYHLEKDLCQTIPTSTLAWATVHPFYISAVNRCSLMTIVQTASSTTNY